MINISTLILISNPMTAESSPSYVRLCELYFSADVLFCQSQQKKTLLFPPCSCGRPNLPPLTQTAMIKIKKIKIRYGLNWVSNLKTWLLKMQVTGQEGHKGTDRQWGWHWTETDGQMAKLRQGDARRK